MGGIVWFFVREGREKKGWELGWSLVLGRFLVGEGDATGIVGYYMIGNFFTISNICFEVKFQHSFKLSLYDYKAPIRNLNSAAVVL